tara:strand:- start:13092 stop:13694 length:603 start_codon:yes stop_codon:yes gene_type:complete
MALVVRQLTKPTITITGKRINIGTTQSDTQAQPAHADTVDTAYTFDHSEVVGTPTGTRIDVRAGLLDKSAIPTFWGNVTLTLSTDYTTTVYNPTGVYIGRQRVADVNRGNKALVDVGGTAELIYTINGKDPTRTKSNLYVVGATSPVTIRRNNGEAITIKAKVYRGQDASPVTIARIRIVNRGEMDRLFGVDPDNITRNI